MADRAPSPRPPARRGSLGKSVLTLAAAATASAAVIWSALFYDAGNRHASAVVAASPPGSQTTAPGVTVRAAPAPVTTRTS